MNDSSTASTSSGSEINIKYLIIGDLDTGKLITEFNANSSHNKKEANQIFNKILKSSERRFDERNKITAKSDCYYFTMTKPNLLFLIYATGKYPERFVFKLIDEINEQKIPSMLNEETKELDPIGRQNLKALIDRYQDFNNLDKIAEIQNEVDSIKMNVKENISAMIKSADDVKSLGSKAQNLKQETQTYNETADELQRVTWWQNFKLWIILGAVVLILILIIFWIVC